MVKGSEGGRTSGPHRLIVDACLRDSAIKKVTSHHSKPTGRVSFFLFSSSRQYRTSYLISVRKRADIISASLSRSLAFNFIPSEKFNERRVRRRRRSPGQWQERMERRHRPSTPHLSLHPLTDVFDNPSYSDGFVASFPVVSELLYSDPKWVLFGSYLYGSRYKKSRESWRNFKNAAIFRRLVVVEKCSSPLVHTCSRTGALYIY